MSKSLDNITADHVSFGELMKADTKLRSSFPVRKATAFIFLLLLEKLCLDSMNGGWSRSGNYSLVALHIYFSSCEVAGRAEVSDVTEKGDQVLLASNSMFALCGS